MRFLLLVVPALATLGVAQAASVGCYSAEIAGNAEGKCGAVAAFGRAEGGIAVVGFGKAEGKTGSIAGVGAAEGGAVALVGHGSADHDQEGIALRLTGLLPAPVLP